jgi:hypothetical protein
VSLLNGPIIAVPSTVGVYLQRGLSDFPRNLDFSYLVCKRDRASSAYALRNHTRSRRR